MNMNEIYDELKYRFTTLYGVEELMEQPVVIVPDNEPETTLLPEGDVISAVNRPEYRVTAKICGSKGEAYTECPEGFEGTLGQVLKLPVSEKGIDARILASMNAVMNHLGLCPGTMSEDPKDLAEYADALCRHITVEYGTGNLVLVGYDGYLVKRFMDEKLDFWTLDRNPEHITKDRFHHVIVNSGRYNRESCQAWGRLLIVTGSTFCNGTVTQFLDMGLPVLFYGITCAAAATLLELPWFRRS